ncbi:MAG: 30S ribosomal protein S4, partial [Candidatus Altiarchaeota archaeon]|nr:30S ribosomal protein S4 [Candidatus Altiarchaeota archaeon]
DKARLLEEGQLMSLYGLKNKRELWKAKAIISSFRNSGRKFFTDETGKDEVFAKLKKQGILKGDFGLDDLLGLTVKDLLERRLQTIVYRKGLAGSVSQSRQLITHGHIKVGDGAVTIPSYHVNVDEEAGVEYIDRSPIADPKHPLRQVPEEETKEAEEKPADSAEVAEAKLKAVDKAIKSAKPTPEEMEEKKDVKA